MSIHGVGIDVGSIPRAAALIERFGEHFVGRWFDDAEMSDPRFRPSWVARELAAKEAVWKALRIDEHTAPPWRQIIITADPCRNILTVRLEGELASTAAALGVGPILVSATVSGDLAVALAIAERADCQ
ncbi:MAG: 4'-phosphopantetheinyl transferase superfamily protein [Actinobacteria bacterium]|nr:4'-phosphopantetheinyl transferase superfamily protein [Actinomycetota bacterium]